MLDDSYMFVTLDSTNNKNMNSIVQVTNIL